MRPWPVRLESLALAQLEGCHMADDLQGRRGRRRDQRPHASAGLLPPQPPAPWASGARGVQPRGLQEQGVGRWPVIPVFLPASPAASLSSVPVPASPLIFVLWFVCALLAALVGCVMCGPCKSHLNFCDFSPEKTSSTAETAD